MCSSLLDNTIVVYYAESLKFFLSLYGHKLTINCFDISSDSYLLLSGSADKNLKIWGLDFGDCRKSIFAHDLSITGVCFVPETHLAFSCSMDSLIKYWDLDKY